MLKEQSRGFYSFLDIWGRGIWSLPFSSKLVPLHSVITFHCLSGQSSTLNWTEKKKLQLYFNTRIIVKNTTPPPEQISNNISTIKTKNQTDTNRKTTHNQLYTAQNLIDTQGKERKDSHFCNTKSGSLAVSRAAIYVLLRSGSW